MKWSWKLGSVAGIGIYVHATFLLIIGFVLLTHWLQGDTLPYTLGGVLFTVTIFACVLLHELGHALTAKRFGIKTKDITLLPIGGVARLERMPEKPVQELWVAVAGPAVNVVIAGLLLVWILSSQGLEPLHTLSVTEGPFLERLMVINVFLVGFNLIPAFPMDGGRVLRSILAMNMEYARATQIAAGLGQGIAFVFGFVGFFTNPFLIFIAFFVWIGAQQEASMTHMKSALTGVYVRDAMITDFKALSVDDPLLKAVELILTGSQQDFPVLEGEAVIGVLTRSDLLFALARPGQKARVGDVARRDTVRFNADDPLEPAYARLRAGRTQTAPVIDEGRLVGILTLENVGELVAIHSAIQGKDSSLGKSMLQS